MQLKAEVITDFSAGELSGKFGGRFNLPIYWRGGQTVKNWVPFPQGGVITRPGLSYKATTYNTAKARLIPFAVNASNPFVLEFTNAYIRVWKSGSVYATITGSPPYTAAQLFYIQFQQVGNVMYLVHDQHPIATITWSGGTTFTLADITIEIETSIDAWQGSTAYEVGDVVTNGTPTKCYSCITAGTSAGSGGPTTEGDDITDGTVHWIWEWTKPFSQADDYPSAIGYMNQRMIYGGTVNRPQWTWTSLPYWYNAFSYFSVITYTYTGVKDDSLWANPNVPETETVTKKSVITGEGSAFFFQVASKKEDSIYGYAAAEALIVFSSENEWVVPKSVNALDIEALHRSGLGSARLQPIIFNDAPIMAVGNNSKARLYEYAYLAESAALQSTDLSYHADQMLENGITQLDSRTMPQPEIFCVTNGEIAVLVHDKPNGARAWYHFDTDGGTIESVAVVPGTTDYDVYLSVNRANGRVIEMLDPMWDLTKVPLDSYVEVASIAGATETGLERFNGQTVTIWNVTDSEVHTAAVSGGSLTYPTGCDVGDNVFIGKAITCELQTMRLNRPQMKRDNVVGVTARVLNSMPFKAGFKNDASWLETARRSDEVTWNSAYSGDVYIPFQGEWSKDSWVWIVQDQPYRSCVLALVPEVAET